ncbi:DUF4350 domain-containing protein [Haloarcula litorea]|uniref:DUF4350 domain-containing protein n=1 Tax=Haloarcula litorea TaxID=3032579 RepID=UPI0023E8A3DC|nr:DUF4350 domain-containing protein [Halomicroarcula sp. GDY20]
MGEGRVITLLATYIVLVALAVGVVAAAGFVAGADLGRPDGATIEGQSPPQYQPERVEPAVDPETGEITVAPGDAEILVDTTHDNAVEPAELEPLAGALFAAGHRLRYTNNTTAANATGPPFGERLDGHAGLLLVQPTEGFTDRERAAVREYTAAGGHVVVLAEPTQTRVAGRSLNGTPTVSFAANDLTSAYGIRMGSDVLYNIDDDRNDNNFKSVYTAPTGSGPLTDGAGTVTLDTGGYALVDGPARPVYTAVEGTRTLRTRRTGQFPTVARTENLVFVADTSLVTRSEVYDADNEAFVGNLLTFLANGDAPGRADDADTGSDGTGS